MNALLDGTPSKPSLWREVNLRWYLGGQLVSLTGSLLQTAVQALLVVTIVGKDKANTWTGIIWALGLFPGMLFAPFGGLLFDWWNKRKVLIVTGVIGIAQALALAYFTYEREIALWQLAVLGLVLGFVNAIDGPGRNAILKDVVDPANMKQASKLFSSLYNIAQLAGPGMAGYLVITFGYSFTFLLNALSFVALIVALLNMRLRVREPAQAKGSVWAQVVGGGRYAFGEPGIRICIMLTTVVCMFGYSSIMLRAVINKYLLGGGEISFGYLSAASGIGAFGAVLLSLAFGNKVPHKWAVVLGLVFTGSSLIFLSQTESIRFAMVWFFVAGAGFMLSFTTLRSSMMCLAKKEAVGIVVGYAFTFFFGGIVLCACVISPLADYLGLPLMLVVNGAALLGAAALTPFLPGINEL